MVFALVPAKIVFAVSDQLICPWDNHFVGSGVYYPDRELREPQRMPRLAGGDDVQSQLDSISSWDCTFFGRQFGLAYTIFMVIGTDKSCCI